MVSPEATSAYKYNGKTFDTKKDALQAEVNDRITEIMKSNTAEQSGYYWPYVQKSFMNNIDEIDEIITWYKQESHAAASQQAPNHDAGWNW